MHDIRFIRENPQAFDAGLARRGLADHSSIILSLDQSARNATTLSEIARGEHKQLSKQIGAAKQAERSQTTLERLAAAGSSSALEDRSQDLKALIGHKTIEADEFVAKRNSLLETLPNLPLADVPDGASEGENVLEKIVGKPPSFAFAAVEHDVIGPALGMDFDTGVAMSGSRFTLLRGHAARLHSALGQFMLATLTGDHGYEQVVPPLLVRDEAMFGTGQLPKFAEDLFKTQIGFDRNEAMRQIEIALQEQERNIGSETTLTDDFRAKIRAQTLESFTKAFEGNPANRRWLIPTAEVSLTNIVRERILPEGELPLRFTALTPCFRSEAGAAGRDTRGFIRQHQFEKAEMVSIVTPEASEAEHERMTAAAEDILIRLGLPFRRMKLCTGDMGFAAARTYDLEVWLPGQARYREISSVSTCTDFQARRMNARYRPEGHKATRFVHTLNGSGLAVGRTLVAVIENYQQKDGAVAIPDVLAPWFAGENRLEPKR